MDLFVLTFIIGSFGRVRLCKRKSDGKHYALKMLKKADIIKLKQVDHVISEMNILSDINSPFLVRNDQILVSDITFRSVWMDSHKTLDTCISFSNTFQAVNCFRT